MTSQINLDQQVVVPYNFTSSPSTPRLEALRLEGIVARRSLHGSTTSLQSCLKDPLVRTMVIFVCVRGDWFWWKLLRIKDPLFPTKISCFVAMVVLPVCVSHPCIVWQILFNSHSCDFIYCPCLCVVIVFLFLAESPLNNSNFREKKTSVGISSKNKFSSETKILGVSIPRAVGWASQKMFGWVFVRSEKRFHLEIETTDYRNSTLAKICIAFCTIVVCKPILFHSWSCRGVDYSHFFQFPPPRFQKFQN